MTRKNTNEVDWAALMTMWAPLIHLDPLDEYLPCSVEWYLNRVGVATFQPGLGYVPRTQPPTTPDIIANYCNGTQTETDAFALMPTDPDATYPGMQVIQHADGPDEATAMVYCNIIPLSGTIYDLQYWLCYAYDRPPRPLAAFFGSHVGDWEHVTVRIDTSQTDQDAMFMGVYGSAHNGEGKWNLNPLQWSEGNDQSWHPIVFSARGSHANYGDLGNQDPPGSGNGVIDRSRLVGDDFVSTNGPIWKTWKNLEQIAWPVTDATQNWLAFNGVWGNTLPPMGSPSGPAMKASFNASDPGGPTKPGAGNLLLTYDLPLPDPQSDVTDMPMIAANETIYATAQGRVFNLRVGEYQLGSQDAPSYFDTGPGAGGQALASGPTYLYAAANGVLYIRGLAAIEVPLGLDTPIATSTGPMNVICFPSGNDAGDDWVFVSTAGDADGVPGYVYFYSVGQDGSAAQLIASATIDVTSCDSPEEVRMACDGTYLWAGLNGYLYCLVLGQGLASAISSPVDFTSCWGLVDVFPRPKWPGQVYASCGGRVYLVYLDGNEAPYLSNHMSGTPSTEIRLAAISDDYLFIATINNNNTYTVWKLDPNDDLDTVATVTWENAGTDNYCVVPLLFPEDGVLLASGMYYPVQIDPTTLNVLVEFYSDSVSLVPAPISASSPDEETARDDCAAPVAVSLGACATSPRAESNIHPNAISEIAYFNGAVYVATLEGKVNAYNIEPAA